eukprot:856702-Amphidinium_carterae.1
MGETSSDNITPKLLRNEYLSSPHNKVFLGGERGGACQGKYLRGPGVRWRKPSWAQNPPVLSSDYIQRLSSPPAGTAQLHLIVDVADRMSQFAGLDGVPMPKVVIADISKAITCMSRGSAWWPSMHVGAMYLTGSPPLFADQSVNAQTAEIACCAIAALGIFNQVTCLTQPGANMPLA